VNQTDGGHSTAISNFADRLLEKLVKKELLRFVPGRFSRDPKAHYALKELNTEGLSGESLNAWLTAP
jgi:hypothetical protein